MSPQCLAEESHQGAKLILMRYRRLRSNFRCGVVSVSSSHTFTRCPVSTFRRWRLSETLFSCLAYLSWAYEVDDSSAFGRLQCLSRWWVFAISSLESSSVEKSPSVLTNVPRTNTTRPRHSLFSLVGLVWISQDERLTETRIFLVSVSYFSLSLERGVLSSTILCPSSMLLTKSLLRKADEQRQIDNLLAQGGRGSSVSTSLVAMRVETRWLSQCTIYNGKIPDRHAWWFKIPILLLACPACWGSCAL